MGMTDKQFNAHLRSLIARLDAAIKVNDLQPIKELRDELQKNLEE